MIVIKWQVATCCVNLSDLHVTVHSFASLTHCSHSWVLEGMISHEFCAYYFNLFIFSLPSLTHNSFPFAISFNAFSNVWKIWWWLYCSILLFAVKNSIIDLCQLLCGVLTMANGLVVVVALIYSLPNILVVLPILVHQQYQAVSLYFTIDWNIFLNLFNARFIKVLTKLTVVYGGLVIFVNASINCLTWIISFQCSNIYEIMVYDVGVEQHISYVETI